VANRRIAVEDGDAVAYAELERDYPPSLVFSEPPDSAWQPHWEELPLMERNAQEELKAHLKASNEEFQKLATRHSELAQQLDALELLPHLTQEQELEETRLKKLKLRLKDQMEAIMSQYRSQQVA
jgi:uncharacterized protein YdcH (DUF465 family)